MKQVNYAQKFIANFRSYKMDIQAAGMASIPAAELTKGNQLVIDYEYKAGSESRSGRMTLSLNVDSNQFEGNWKTLADNGNSYQGSMYFVFKENGEADGFYSFSGSDYKITIILK